MCGRIAQAKNPLEYAHILGWKNAGHPASDEYRHGYNIAPTTKPLLAYPDGNFRAVRWGYKPFWAREKKMPPSINARVETAAKGAYFRTIFKSGRTITMADGWYEWILDDDKKKTPYFIRLKSKEPMCLAALTSVHEEKDMEDELNGFVIVTAASDSGMVDIHDRRPLVFTPDNAHIWMNPDTPVDEANLLAHDSMRPTDDFEWFKVSRDVNKVGNDGEHLIEPLLP